MPDLQTISQWLAENPNGTEAQANALVAAGQLAADPIAETPTAPAVDTIVPEAAVTDSSQSTTETSASGTPNDNPNIPAGMVYSDAVLGWVPVS